MEFFVEGVGPEVAHVVPVADDAVFHWLGDLEVGALGGGFVTDHDVFDLYIADAFFGTEDGAPDDGWEDCVRKREMW